MTDDQPQAVDLALAPERFLLPGSMPVTRNPALVYIAAICESSQPTQKMALNAIVKIVAPGSGMTYETFPWASVDYGAARAILSRVNAKYSIATAKRIRVALRRVLEEAWTLRLYPLEELTRVKTIKAPKGKALTKGRALPVAEVRGLIDACGKDAAGWRNRALVALLFGGGLRRAEVVGIALAQFDAARCSVVVLGKGNKERRVHIPKDAASYVSDWIEVRGRAPGPLLLATGRHGDLTGRALSTSSVWSILATLADKTGIEVAPHDARRTRITSMLDAKENVAVIARIAGHESVETTGHYDRSEEDEEMAAAQRVPLL